jgi:HTH-type transcriptional regulator / antitoxin HigA
VCNAVAIPIVKCLTVARAHALKEIERLWNAVQKNTPEGDYFEVLLTLVHAYDNEHDSMPKPDPIASIKFRMEQQGLSNKAA